MNINRRKTLFKPIILGVMVTGTYAFSALSLGAQPESLTQIGRYMTATPKIKPQQFDLLSVNVQMHFMPETKTIGEAMADLLQYSGYSLVDVQYQCLDFQNTLKKPLPLVYRDLEPVSLRQALALLAGSAFELVVDPLNRTVNFRLKTEYKK